MEKFYEFKRKSKYIFRSLEKLTLERYSKYRKISV